MGQTTTQELSTILTTKYIGNINGAELFVREIKQALPEKPKKPLLSEHTSQAAAKYASDLGLYENRSFQYEKEQEEVLKYNRSIQNTFHQWVKEQSNLTTIPEQYQEKLWNYCLEHTSGGVHDAYIKCNDLIDSIF